MDDNLKSELKFIGKYSLVLNIVAYLVSLAVVGLNISMLLGLLIGTVVEFVYLIMLYKSIEKSVGLNEKSAQSKMMGGYLLRLLVIGVAMVTAFKVSCINPVGVFLPVFYPKIIYVGGAIFKRKGGV